MIASIEPTTERNAFVGEVSAADLVSDYYLSKMRWRMLDSWTATLRWDLRVEMFCGKSCSRSGHGESKKDLNMHIDRNCFCENIFCIENQDTDSIPLSFGWVIFECSLEIPGMLKCARNILPFPVFRIWLQCSSIHARCSVWHENPYTNRMSLGFSRTCFSWYLQRIICLVVFPNELERLIILRICEK